MIILAVDPGTVQSAWLVWADGSVANHAIELNIQLIKSDLWAALGVAVTFAEAGT